MGLQQSMLMLLLMQCQEQSLCLGNYDQYFKQQRMNPRASPSVPKSPSLKSLSDSEANITCSDIDDADEKHQETVKRFSILSGIEEELTRKVEQPKLVTTNDVIEEEEEEQSISISRRSENEEPNINRVEMAVPYSREVGMPYGKKVQNYLQVPEVEENQQPSPRYSVETLPKNGNPSSDANPLKTSSFMYRVTKQINLLQPPPCFVEQRRNFSKKPLASKYHEQQGLFAKACETERRRNTNLHEPFPFHH